MLYLQLPAVILNTKQTMSIGNSKPLSSIPVRFCSTPKRSNIVDHHVHDRPININVRFRLAAALHSATDVEESVVVGLVPEPMPKHVALIMDGNGRWAKNRGLSTEHGHRAGMKALKNVAFKCSEFGIRALTVFAFSTENWKRSKVEVDFLMTIIEEFIRVDVDDLIQLHNARFSTIGDGSRLPESLQSAISSAEEAGRSNKGVHFVMALNYGGRYDLTEAARKIATKVEDGILRADDVDETVFEQQLVTNSMEFSNPDFLIRTSGELRISNFMLWQLAYAELYFADKLFPDFGADDLIQALACFQRRNRRFGQRNK